MIKQIKLVSLQFLIFTLFFILLYFIIYLSILIFYLDNSVDLMSPIALLLASAKHLAISEHHLCDAIKILEAGFKLEKTAESEIEMLQLLSDFYFKTGQKQRCLSVTQSLLSLSGGNSVLFSNGVFCKKTIEKVTYLYRRQRQLFGTRQAWIVKYRQPKFRKGALVFQENAK